MTLTSIVIFGIGAVFYGLVVPAKWRGWALLAASVVAIYWLQPAIPVRPVDFVLPTATLVLAVAGWLITRQEPNPEQDNRLALGLIVVLVVAIAAVGGLVDITASPPPGVPDVVIPLVGVAIALAAFSALVHDRLRAISVFILLILVLFAVLKADALSEALSAWLRARTGRPLHLAQVSDVQWFGFSYVAFRMIHTLRDRQTGKLPALSLREYVTYLIFFASYTAGPIDRAERFVKDYRALPAAAIAPDASRTTIGLSRIVIGIFKKFVVADSLAVFALNATKALEAQSSGGMWLLVYAYTFRIYFDFAGYSDIAIGLGILFGINLPENFDRPYLKSNLTAFWQSWHITLSNWARFYVFTPLSRNLMGRPKRPSPAMIVLICQVATMVVIGLWHGITPNFVIWGLWHGVGLWVHKLFTDRTRTFYQGLNERPRLQRAIRVGSTLLTFHYVALGWVWFALPDVTASWHVLARLFGG